MFGKKQIQRTCKGCGQTRYVPHNLRDLEIPKPLGPVRRALISGVNEREHQHKTELAERVCRCAQCGSDSYRDKEVRL